MLKTLANYEDVLLGCYGERDCLLVDNSELKQLGQEQWKNVATENRVLYCKIIDIIEKEKQLCTWIRNSSINK